MMQVVINSEKEVQHYTEIAKWLSIRQISYERKKYDENSVDKYI